MAFTIKQEGDMFVLYDDGLVFDRYATRAEAEAQQAELEVEDVLAEAVSDAVDEMMDKLTAQFPKTSRDIIKQMIVENLS